METEIELKEKFKEIDAHAVYTHLSLGNAEKFQEELLKYDGDTEKLEELIEKYRKHRQENITESETWESLATYYEDSNTEKTEAVNKTAQFLKRRFNFKTPRDTKQLWVFKNPVYEQDGPQVVKEECYKHLGKYLTPHNINQIEETVKSQTFCDRQEEKPPLKYIPVENGWYNLKENDLEEPQPEYFAVNHIPVEYDPEADCPKVKDFISEVVEESDLPLIQEMIGYCLYRGYPIARAFMLLGSGSNGKSTLLNILKHFLGRDNIGNPSLQKLGEDRFASAQLYGKLANIHADLSSKTLENTGTFKMLTGGDLIHAERKFQDPFQFENYAKLIYSANELPGTKDTTDAFFRRWIVIKFPYKFTNNEGDGNKDKNPDIVEEIICEEEMSGLFNWAIEGLNRVLENNGFSRTRGRDAVKNEWLLRTQPLLVFFDKAVEEEAGVSIGKDEIYSDYDAFCESVGVVSKDRSVFFKQLYSEFPQVSDQRVRSNGNRKQILTGITTKELEEVVRVVKGKSDLTRSAHAHSQRVGHTPDRVDQEEENRNLYKEVADYVGKHDEIYRTDIISSFDADEQEIEQALEDLIEDGTLFEPKPGMVKKL